MGPSKIDAGGDRKQYTNAGLTYNCGAHVLDNIDISYGWYTIFSIVYCLVFMLKNFPDFCGLLCNREHFLVNFCKWILWKLVKAGNCKRFSGMNLKMWNSKSFSSRIISNIRYITRLINITIFVTNTSHNDMAMYCSLASCNYTVVAPLSMGRLYHQVENQNITKFACNFVFLLLTNPSSVEESFWKSKPSLQSC